MELTQCCLLAQTLVRTVPHISYNVARNRVLPLIYVFVAVVGVVTLWETKGNKCLMYWTTDLLEVSESMHSDTLYYYSTRYYNYNYML